MTTRLCLAALAAVLTAHAAHAQVFQAYRGTLASGDPALDSGEFADVYTITVPRGAATLLVSMVSTALDSYVLVRGPGGEREDNDDASGGGLDATAIVLNPAAGEWRVTATSARPAETGAYELVLGAGNASDIIGRLGTLTDGDYATEPGGRTGGRAGGTAGGTAGGAPAAPAGGRVPLNTGRRGGGTPASGNTASGAVQLQVLNRTGQSVYYLYAAPCGSSDWGADRLGSGVVLSTGDAATLALAPGCWNVKARFADEQEAVNSGWTLAAGSAEWTLTAD